MPNDDIPDIIANPDSGAKYTRGAFYGKGGFAKCYEIKNLSDRQSYAGKIVSKKLLSGQHQREKMTQEIWIHKSLSHINIVGFHSFFEDDLNVYIVLELCTKKSMMELHKRRKYLTEPETKYYMKQIINGVEYLHQQKIIHRDLKLGNLFLNDKLIVKIGDFGLAAKIEFENERKKTLCGTPNYIAPEILNKKGHSFEVDIWSMGCIMYTLLCGKPPFETQTLKETYVKIRKCEYKWIISSISDSAKNMIGSMLQAEPKRRPKISQLHKHSFMMQGYCPTNLPLTSLSTAPRFDAFEVRKPLWELNNENSSNVPVRKKEEVVTNGTPLEGVNIFNSKENFSKLGDMVLKVLKTRPARDQKFLEEMSDPQAQPMYWISKWVDYSDKYGFGYQLSDETVGVMFNDTTKLILLPNGINVHYIDRDGSEYYMTLTNYPKEYDKKMKLLSYFGRYMKENLVMTGASAIKENDCISRMPYLYQWYRFVSGVLMQLNNGTVQMNFGDHTKIIMCPLMGAVTYIDEDRSFRTFKFDTIMANGCCVGLYEKLRYAFEKITLLLEKPVGET